MQNNMDIELNPLPVIDWDHSLKLAGHDTRLATDILAFLIKNLPEDLLIIKKLSVNDEYQELTRVIHKLHGAVCYSGTPRLKILLKRLETDLKNHIMDDLPSLLNQLETEVSLLLEQYSRLHI
ncbi:MAG: hybrid sensory histidine kinase BarA [uncultured bacterium]|nr:MAG: hybrid sensory histidine kinase BarA [uncultured bacterium]